jgi:hypothetical protein
MTSTLNLTGLRAAPAQVRGAVRLVPLLREKPCDDVRLTARAYQNKLAAVALPDQATYWGFVPHGLILNWSETGSPVAALGGQVKRLESKTAPDWLGINYLEKMAKREGAAALRFLPLHTAMEGFLALHFGGPNIKWEQYSRHAFKFGLSPRSERTVSGHGLVGFEDALRTFELHPGQVGMLVFVADALASAFVVPNAEDYRDLHNTLLQDFYGELIAQYAVWYDTVPTLEATPQTAGAQSLTQLRQALEQARTRWAQAAEQILGRDLIGRELQRQTVYQPGPLKLERFVTNLDPNWVNHIGERLTRADGEVLYLKTFTLSSTQTKRAYLLSQLAAHDWHLESAAAHLNISSAELIVRLGRAGFGELFKPDVLAKASRDTGARAKN